MALGPTSDHMLLAALILHTHRSVFEPDAATTSTTPLTTTTTSDKTAILLPLLSNHLYLSFRTL